MSAASASAVARASTRTPNAFALSAARESSSAPSTLLYDAQLMTWVGRKLDTACRTAAAFVISRSACRSARTSACSAYSAATGAASCAPAPVMRIFMAAAGPFRPAPLRSSVTFHGRPRFTIRFAALDGLALVVQLLAASESNLHFHPAVLEIHAERHE